MLVHVLIAVRSKELSERLAALAGGADVRVEQLEPDTAAPLVGGLRTGSADLVLLDLEALPRPRVDAVRAIRRDTPPREVLGLSESAGPEAVADLHAAGVLAVLSPAVPDATLAQAIHEHIARRRDALLHRLQATPGERPLLADLVSESPRMQSFLTVAARVAGFHSSILLQGETGSGKEWVARAVHEESPRAEGPLVAVNCGALPESLLESELFGHERGAFTGAVDARRGYFELAHGGTIFLDEIGEMPVHLQVRLLRVLQEKKIRRLGGESVVEVDVRVIAATNRDLEREVAEGRFREDLYYRLSVVTLTVPPLRDRREDIVPIADSYLAKFGSEMGRPGLMFDEAARRVLETYHWPGNVRELVNVVERAVLLGTDEMLSLDDLPDKVVAASSAGVEMSLVPDNAPGLRGDLELDDSWATATLGEVKRAYGTRLERAYLDLQLRLTRGRVGACATRAGIARRSLYEKMKAHGLAKEDYR